MFQRRQQKLALIAAKRISRHVHFPSPAFALRHRHSVPILILSPHTYTYTYTQHPTLAMHVATRTPSSSALYATLSHRTYTHTYMTCTSRMTWHHGSFIIIFITTTVMTGVMCHNTRGSPGWLYFFVLLVTVTAEASIGLSFGTVAVSIVSSISAHIVASPL